MAGLIDWCCDEAQLQRYETHVVSECEQLADISLLRHLRQLLQVVQQLRVEGRERMIEQQTAALDALFTDMLATATWHDWEAPLEVAGSGELALDVQQRGLLGADEISNAAMLFVVDPACIAICRQRAADHEARHPHDTSLNP